MLTLEENSWNLQAFKILSILNILPIQVKTESGKILFQRQSNKLRIFIWKIMFLGGIMETFYVSARLIYSINHMQMNTENYFEWENLALHIPTAVGSFVFYATACSLLFLNMEEYLIILNKISNEGPDAVQKMMDEMDKEQQQYEAGNQNRNVLAEIGNSVRLPEVRPLLTWPPQYSLHDLMTRTLPLVLLVTGIGFIIILVSDPSRPQILYNIVPHQYQNVYSFIICSTAEAFFCTSVFSFGYFSVVVQLSSFSKIQSEYQQLHLQLRNLKPEQFQNRLNGGRDIGREIRMLRKILQRIKEIAVFIHLFNHCFPLSIFLYKFYCLSVCITFYFFAIRHYLNFPVVALFTGYGGMLTNFLYTIMYDQAFSVPEKMDRLKHEFLLTAKKSTSGSAFFINLRSKSRLNTNANVWREMKREIKRIRNSGIKVGQFHTLERESTPNFMNFVVDKVVTLLVTFP